MIRSLPTILLRLVVVTLLLFLFLEISVRIFLGTPPSTSMIMSDPVLNHKLRPNMIYYDYSRPIPYTVYTNTESWPQRSNIPLKKSQSTLRIFYIGDSNTQSVVDD